LKKIIFSCLFAGLVSGLSAQLKSEVNAFLGIGFAADQKAHGNTGVALPTGSGAFWYNPALPAQSNQHSVHYTHAALFGNLAVFDVASYSRKLNETTSIGIGFARMGVDDIQNTLALFDENDEVDYSRISTFSASDQVLYLSGNKVWKSYTVGVGAKLIYRKIGDFASAIGIGFDLGIAGKWKGWDVGAALKDATTTTSYWIMDFTDDEKAVFDATGNDIPENGTESMAPHLAFGFSKKFRITDKIEARPIVDLELYPYQRGTPVETSWISLDPKVGAQIYYKTIFAVNLGVERWQNFETQDGAKINQISPTMGVELRLKRFRIQYGLSSVGEDSDLLNNVFGIGVQF